MWTFGATRSYIPMGMGLVDLFIGVHYWNIWLWSGNGNIFFINCWLVSRLASSTTWFLGDYIYTYIYTYTSLISPWFSRQVDLWFFPAGTTPSRSHQDARKLDRLAASVCAYLTSSYILGGLVGGGWAHGPMGRWFKVGSGKNHMICGSELESLGLVSGYFHGYFQGVWNNMNDGNCWRQGEYPGASHCKWESRRILCWVLTDITLTGDK